MYTITYAGKPYSLNAAFAGHWRSRQKRRDELKVIFTRLLQQAQIPPLEAYTLQLCYHAATDVENNVPLAKVLCDVMKAQGIITDDKPAIYQSFSVTFDSELAKNTFVFLILPTVLKPRRVQ